MNKDAYLIWWLSEAATKAVLENPKDLPEYILREVEGRVGRAGRCRLWVPSSLPQELGIDPWPDTPLAKKLQDLSVGGIVFRFHDLYLVRKFSGFITDFALNEIT